MKNINIGKANLLISNKLKNNYFNIDLITESTKISNDFIDLIKQSPILQLEFKAFSNLENKFIENDLTATRYIDTNIKLFETFTINEINEEHKKLEDFLKENGIEKNVDDIDSNKLKLYESIGSLIIESITSSENIDVDNVHNSFNIVLEHIQTPERFPLMENIEMDNINNEIIEIAVDKFNKKYETLDESEKILLKMLTKSTDLEKQELLETYKTDVVNLLENADKTNIEDKIGKTVEKINKISYNSNTVNCDIVDLHELKKDLL